MPDQQASFPITLACTWHPAMPCRALLANVHPRQLLVVASLQAAAHSGLAPALGRTAGEQVPLPRGYFDDSKVIGGK